MAKVELDDGNWHLDKRVPIGLVVMIIVQTIVFVFAGTSWKSAVDNRLDTLEKYAVETTRLADNAADTKTEISNQGQRIGQNEKDINTLVVSIGDLAKKMGDLSGSLQSLTAVLQYQQDGKTRRP